MLRVLVTVLGLMFTFVTQSWAAPQISSVSGSLQHRATLTISGTGFGTKSPAAPLLWDDGEHGQPVSARWGQWAPSASGASYNMDYRTQAPGRSMPQAHSRSTRFASGGGYGLNGGVANGSNTGWNVILFKNFGKPSERWFSSWYAGYDPDYYDAVQTKSSRGGNKLYLWQDNAGFYAGAGTGSSYAYTNSYWEGSSWTDPAGRWRPENNWQFGYGHNGIGTGGNGDNDFSNGQHGGSSWPPGTWKHIQVLARANASGQPVSWINVIYDHEVQYDKDRAGMPVGDSNGWVWGDFINFPVYGIGIGGHTDYNQGSNHPGFWRYFDDIYIDNTFARVVLGNASTYDGSAIREMQIPSAWSNTSITVTVNLGRLGTSSYLYVFDADGNVNANGIPVGCLSCPSPPTSLRVK